VQRTKRALNRSFQARAGEVLDLSFALESLSLTSDDLVEAITAFRTKRQPNYRGT
jgi:enoyl-CoA hydratase